MDPFRVSLAPDQLWQAINPWTFSNQGAQLGLINISLGATPQPETERAILAKVGSYGRQLGRIGDALEVLIGQLDRGRLSPAQDDALTILLGQLAEIRGIKRAESGDAAADGASAAPGLPVSVAP